MDSATQLNNLSAPDHDQSTSIYWDEQNIWLLPILSEGFRLIDNCYQACIGLFFNAALEDQEDTRDLPSRNPRRFNILRESDNSPQCAAQSGHVKSSKDVDLLEMSSGNLSELDGSKVNKVDRPVHQEQGDEQVWGDEGVGKIEDGDARDQFENVELNEMNRPSVETDDEEEYDVLDMEGGEEAMNGVTGIGEQWSWIAKQDGQGRKAKEAGDIIGARENRKFSSMSRDVGRAFIAAGKFRWV